MIQKTPGGTYYVEGKYGQPSRSFSQKRDAQRYNWEIEQAELRHHNHTQVQNLVNEAYSLQKRLRDTPADETNYVKLEAIYVKSLFRTLRRSALLNQLTKTI
jgi:ribosomal protein S15P/S13E